MVVIHAAMKRNTKYKVALLLGSVLLSLLLVEITMRMFIVPSPYSYGNFLGHELPPLKIGPVTGSSKKMDRSVWYRDLIVNGKKITVGDLW